MESEKLIFPESVAIDNFAESKITTRGSDSRLETGSFPSRLSVFAVKKNRWDPVRWTVI
jgi:hypothetical protein